METVALVLQPLIELLRWMLDALYVVTRSYGLSIILLSTVVRTVMIPISRKAAAIERRDAALQVAMASALSDIKANYRGRERFERIEALYAEHGYHPIHSMASILPLVLQLPILLAALILLTSYGPLAGEGFLLLENLGAPDQLLPLIPTKLYVNLLPILLTVIAITEVLIKRGTTDRTRIRFIVVAMVIAILIYPLPSAVCLYWLTSNVWSLVSELVASRFSKAQSPTERTLSL